MYVFINFVIIIYNKKEIELLYVFINNLYFYFINFNFIFFFILYN